MFKLQISFQEMAENGLKPPAQRMLDLPCGGHLIMDRETGQWRFVVCEAKTKLEEHFGGWQRLGRTADAMGAFLNSINLENKSVFHSLIRNSINLTSVLSRCCCCCT